MRIAHSNGWYNHLNVLIAKSMHHQAAIAIHVKDNHHLHHQQQFKFYFINYENVSKCFQNETILVVLNGLDLNVQLQSKSNQ